MSNASSVGWWAPEPYDRNLDVAIVRRVLREQFPDLSEGSVEFHGWGWEHDAYVVDQRWLFRFPRHAGSGALAEMRWEAGAIERVAAAVGDAFRVPRVLLWGEPSAHFPYRFYGHEFIPGIGSDHPSALWAPELAEDLGSALTLLHSVAPSPEEKAEADASYFGSREPRDGVLWCLEQVPQLREIVPAECAWVEDESVVPRDFSGERRFIHGDLHPEHILVDRLTGRLTGIVDWAPGFGDPAHDFEFLLVARGLSFLLRAIRTYAVPVDAEFLERTIYFARLRALGWLADAVRRGANVETDIEILRRTFAPVEDAHSTLLR